MTSKGYLIFNNYWKIFFIIIGLISIILSSSGYYFNKNQLISHSPSTNSLRVPNGIYNYSIEITVNFQSNYLLYVPLPLLGNTTFSSFIFLSGIGEFGLINTSWGNNGTGLWINGNNSLKMIAIKHGCTWVNKLTMMENYQPGQHFEYNGKPDFTVWVYCERDLADQQIDLNITSSSYNWLENIDHELVQERGMVKMNLHGLLSEGWSCIGGDMFTLYGD